MRYTEHDIIHEGRHHFVIQTKKGFEVYRIGVTHATRCASIGWPFSEKGRSRAIAECQRRDAKE